MRWGRIAVHGTPCARPSCDSNDKGKELIAKPGHLHNKKLYTGHILLIEKWNHATPKSKEKCV